MSVPEPMKPKVPSDNYDVAMTATSGRLAWLWPAVALAIVAVLAFVFIRGCNLVDRVNDIDSRLHRIEGRP